MPNDVCNYLTVTNLTEKEGKRLVAALVVKDQFPETFLPEPDWESMPVDGKLPTVKEEDGRKYRYLPDGEEDDRWYDWRNSNWGTKWPAYEVEVNAIRDSGIPVIGGPDEEYVSGEVGFTVEACYLTAWSPLAENCIAKVSEQMPDAVFSVRYYEPGNDFFGTTVARGGVAIDMSEDLSTVYHRWEADNIDAIRKAVNESPDQSEEGMHDAIEELWIEGRGAYLEKFQKELAASLMASLKEKVAVSRQLRSVAPERPVGPDGKKVSFTEYFKKRLGEIRDSD